MQDLATLMVGPVSKQDRVGLGQTTYIRKSYTSDWPASDIEYQAKKKPDKAVEYAHFATKPKQKPKLSQLLYSKGQTISE